MEDDKDFQNQALASLLSGELASYAATCKRLTDQGQKVETGADGIYKLLYRFLQDLGITSYELESLLSSWKVRDLYSLPQGFVTDLAALAVTRGARVKIKYDNTYKLKSRDPFPISASQTVATTSGTAKSGLSFMIYLLQLLRKPISNYKR